MSANLRAGGAAGATTMTGSIIHLAASGMRVPTHGHTANGSYPGSANAARARGIIARAVAVLEAVFERRRSASSGRTRGPISLDDAWTGGWYERDRALQAALIDRMAATPAAAALERGPQTGSVVTTPTPRVAALLADAIARAAGQPRGEASGMLTQCGMWLIAGFIGASSFAMGLSLLRDDGMRPAIAAAIALAGATIAVFAWRRAVRVLGSVAATTEVTSPSATQAG
jgi:hypothetical protein